MMKNKIFPLLLSSVGLLVGLTGCGDKDDSGNSKPHYSYAAKSFETSKKIMTLGVGEKGSFLTRISPVIAYDAKLVYVSADSSIASVNEQGEITALKVGNTSVKVSYQKDPKVFADVQITVVNRVSAKSEELTNTVNAVKELQASEDFPELDDLYYREYRDYAIYREGVKIYNTVEYTDFWESKSKAFFALNCHSDEMKVEGGNFEPSDYAWILYTDESYESHMYHVNGVTKTMIDVATQSYMESGQRVNAVKKLLSSLFVDGGKMFNQGYEEALSSKNLDEDFTQFRNLVTEGYIGDGIVGYSLTQKGFKETMDAEDEDDYHIPFGTEVTEDIEFTSMWKDGVVMTNDYTQVFSYELNGVKYSKVWKIYYSYETKNVELPYPKNSEFREVDQLYDL